MINTDDHRQSPVAAAIRKAVTEKAAIFGIPFAIAGSMFAAPVMAQQNVDEDETADEANQNSDGEEVLEEIIVRGSVTMRHTEAFSANKMNMQLKDIAQSVSVITGELMEMADIDKMQDIYRVDASVDTTHRLDDFPTSFFRGFRSQGANYLRIDGFRFPGNIELDMAGFERVEIVKGPTSSVNGQTSIGGAMTAISKTPTAQSRGEFGLELGSFNAYRADFDVSGSFNDDETWQYRLIGVLRDSDTHIETGNDEAWVIIPSIAWEPSDQTRMVATINVQHHEDTNGWGTGLQGLGPENLRVLPSYREHSFGQPWNQREVDTVLGSVHFDHTFDSGWQLRVNAQGSHSEKDTDQCNGDGNMNAQGLQELGCWTYFAIDDDRLFGGEVNLIGDVSLMGREHTLFFGVDYSLQQEEQEYAYDYIDDNGVAYRNGGTAGFQLWPGPSAIQQQFDRNDMQYFYDHKEDVQFAGVTLQALLRPTDNLQILLAGRFAFDEVLERQVRGGDVRPSLIDQPYERDFGEEVSTEEFIPQIGITYSVSETTNIYFNWGETYVPGSGSDRIYDPANPNDGISAPPETGEQFEIGFKADILDNRASITGAYFDMERANIRSDSKENPGFVVPLGGQKTKGVEFAINGNMTQSLEVFWSVAYLDAYYTGPEPGGEFDGPGDAAPAGMRPANTPKFASSLFANYAVTNGALEGLGLGVGWVYKDRYDPWGRVFSEFELDAPGGGWVARDLGDVNEVDISVKYETDNWLFFGSVIDVFDNLYYSANRAELRWGIHVNPGRKFRVGFKRRW